MPEQQPADTPPEDHYEEESTDEATAESGTGEAATAAPPEPLFSDSDRAQFDADDVAAGSHIGKMLAIFFLYTVAAMSIVAWWTFRAVD